MECSFDGLLGTALPQPIVRGQTARCACEIPLTEPSRKYLYRPCAFNHKLISADHLPALSLRASPWMFWFVCWQPLIHLPVRSGLYRSPGTRVGAGSRSNPAHIGQRLNSTEAVEKRAMRGRRRAVFSC